MVAPPANSRAIPSATGLEWGAAESWPLSGPLIQVREDHCMEVSILDGVVIGGAGGAIGGITVWLTQLAQTKILERRDKGRVYRWLLANTNSEAGEQFRSTRTIASWTNLTEDRVRYVCSIHHEVTPSSGTRARCVAGTAPLG